MDTNVAGKAHGHLTSATLDYLQAYWRLCGPSPSSWRSTIPPILTGLEKMDIQNLRDSRKFQTILSGYQGELKLVCGHVHRNITALFGGVICQIAPGTSHAVTMDLRVGALNCLTKEPGAFLLHEIRDGILTHCIPVVNLTARICSILK